MSDAAAPPTGPAPAGTSLNRARRERGSPRSRAARSSTCSSSGSG
ncbi:hypothetical protein ACFQV8_11875 [Pseudonocardia benzenivorans]